MTELAAPSLEKARQAFESGSKFDLSAGREHDKRPRQAMKESGLDGSVYAKTDWRGVVTSSFANLLHSDGSYQRVAQAAEMGFHLAPDSLGEGWEMKAEGPKQHWSRGTQQLTIDSQEHNFELFSSGWVTRHAGSSDAGTEIEIKSKERWQNGRFEHLPIK